jgi:hypothetical protein
MAKAGDPVTTTAERVITLIQAAAQRRLTREQALRRALRDGSAVQIDGKWFVREVADVTTNGVANKKKLP